MCTRPTPRSENLERIWMIAWTRRCRNRFQPAIRCRFRSPDLTSASAADRFYFRASSGFETRSHGTLDIFEVGLEHRHNPNAHVGVIVRERVQTEASRFGYARMRIRK